MNLLFDSSIFDIIAGSSPLYKEDGGLELLNFSPKKGEVYKIVEGGC